MVAESASRKLSATLVGSHNQAGTEQQQNITFAEPSAQAEAVAALESLLDSSPLAEQDYQAFWVALQEMMDSLDDCGDRDLTDAADTAIATLLPLPQTPAAELAWVSTALDEPESPITTSVENGLLAQGELLPFRRRSVDTDFDSTLTWNETLVALGSEIQHIRQAQGLSLDQIRLKTQVPVYQLQALESGAVDQLPEEIFVRGFLKRICGQLGEEGQALLAQVPGPKQERQEILAQWQQPSANSYASEIVHLRSAHLYVGYATLLAGAAGGLAWSFQETAQVNAAPDSLQPTVQSADARTVKLSPAQRVARLAFGSDVAQPEQSAPEMAP